ncbi:MAG: DUF2188 domain-containing protein [Acidobacteria bacterium]|nr:DUF2188 domain-containing protein [Acidobacteriota bacterium]
MNKTYHVVPYKGRQWAIKTAGNGKYLSIHSSKAEAIDTAREKPGTTIVHSPTGVALQPVIVEGVDIDAIREAVRKVGDHKADRLIFRRTHKPKAAKK